VGRIPTGRKPKYTLQHLWERHHAIKRLLIAGLKHKDIAKRLNCTPQNVCDVYNSPLFQEQLRATSIKADDRAIDIARRIEEIAPKAIKVIEETIDDVNGDRKLRVSASQDVLDRAGYGKTQKFRMEGAIAHLTKDDLIDIKNRMNRSNTIIPDNGEEVTKDESI